MKDIEVLSKKRESDAGARRQPSRSGTSGKGRSYLYHQPSGPKG
jgi:hypothetical protein